MRLSRGRGGLVVQKDAFISRLDFKTSSEAHGVTSLVLAAAQALPPEALDPPKSSSEYGRCDRLQSPQSIIMPCRRTA